MKVKGLVERAHFKLGLLVFGATTALLGGGVAGADPPSGFNLTPTAPSQGIQDTANTILSDIEWGVIAMAIATFLVGAARWGWGHHGENMSMSYAGRRAMFAGALGAVFAIGAPSIIHAATNTGLSI